MYFKPISGLHDSALTSPETESDTNDLFQRREALPGVSVPDISFVVCDVGATNNQLFRDLVSAHQVRLYRYVVRYVGHPDEAADITQQTFVEAVRTISTFRGDSTASTWLFGIAMNIARNYLNRAPSRLYDFEDETVLEEQIASSSDPSENAEHKEFLQHVVAALDELPDEMRQIMMMISFGDLSYEEVATILDIPIGTVCSRVSRARATLRRRFSIQDGHIRIPK